MADPAHGPATTDATFVELRIHGVSGTPPESMLQYPVVRLVAGDARSGFYRRTLATPDGPDVVDQRLEAYSWGGLTSGRASRVFWLLLLPFALVNVASWAQPGDPSVRPRIRAVLAAALRLLALTMTGTVVVAAAAIGMDLLGWQCSRPGSVCAQGAALAGALAHLGAPGRRLAAGALVPAGLVVLLWLLGRDTWRHYETVRPAADGLPAGDAPALADPAFWRGGVPVRRLRSLHIAFAWALIAALIAVPALDVVDAASASAWVLHLVLALSTALAVVCGLAVLVPGLTDRRTGRQDEPQLWRVAQSGLSFVALGAAVTAAAAAALPRSSGQPDGRMPAVSGVLELGFAVQVVLVVLLFLGTWTLNRGLGSDPSALTPVAVRGFALPVVASLGWLLAGGLSAGAVLLTASWLTHEDTTPELAPLYPWVSLVAVVLLVTVLPGIGVHAARRHGRLRRAAEEQVRKSNPRGPADGALDDREYRERVKGVANARAWAAMSDAAGTYLAVVVACSSVVVLVATVAYVAGYRTWPQQQLPGPSAFGALLVTGAAAAFVTVGVRAYRDPRLRRTVGILWDVTSFWPRAVHPLAPPCYAEKIIPDLSRRTGALAGESGGGVLLSAHSQGTVIALATVLQLPPDDPVRLCLLTYGAPLTRLYATFFPGYVNRATYDAAARRLGATSADPRVWPWRNLYRLTDPIGGWLLAAAGSAVSAASASEPPPPDAGVPDVLLVDPAFSRPPGDPSWPRTFGHTDYWSDVEFEVLKQRVLALRLGDPTAAMPTMPPGVPGGGAP